MPNYSQNNMTTLPLNTFTEIPQPAPNAQRITAVEKKSGRVHGYQLEDGRLLNKEEAVQLARQGGIWGVGIATRNGNEYLRSLPDEEEQNNLSSLPTVH